MDDGIDLNYVTSELENLDLESDYYKNEFLSLVHNINQINISK